MPSEQDEDAAEVDEAEVVERVALVARGQAAEVAQPGEESLDLPAAPQLYPVIGTRSPPRVPPVPVSTCSRRTQ